MHNAHVIRNWAKANIHAHEIGPMAGSFSTLEYEVMIGSAK